MYHVAILYHVIPPFGAHTAGLTSSRHRPCGQQVGVAHDVGTNKAALHVGVYLAGRVPRGLAAPQRPGAHNFAPGDRKKGDQVE